ncbi:SET domain-containing protein [Mycena olivaceomarginata]|nr:SET domain-containing protein [Mycena olivaceomarginata]
MTLTTMLSESARAARSCLPRTCTNWRSTRGTNRGWRSDASIVPGSSIASTSASGHGGELQDWKDGKEVEVSNREGKVPESRKSLRLQVESAWTALAQGCDGEDDSAAEITFVNDIDVEEIPPSLHGGAFVYLEDRYDPAGTPPFEFYPDSATPLTDAKAFMFCHCKQCDEFDRCCQDTDSDLRFAYTDGLFNFTYGPDDVVVECNPYCNCPTTCGNRVVQRPRRIPIEVFKTERRGWAVRGTEDVVRGTVVGVYTGKLIPRAEAEKLQGDRKQYCFDLDYNEEDVPSEKTYSVDAFECGNWTRFINHSCSPNLRVQPVVYDTLPYQRIAFLAFIALQPIPAWTEFTFDYNPKDQRDYEAAAAAARMGAGGKEKANSKPRRPRGAAICVCGAEKCRGWVRT